MELGHTSLRIWTIGSPTFLECIEFEEVYIISRVVLYGHCSTVLTPHILFTDVMTEISIVLVLLFVIYVVMLVDDRIE